MFRDSLKQTIDRLDGGLGGVLMAFDGISVESYMRGDGGSDIQTIGMELAHVISQVRRAAQSLEAGGLSEIAVRAEKMVVLVHVLNEEYFVACALRPDASFGKARYLMRLLAPQLRSEL